jgi:hypothetical protein
MRHVGNPEQSPYDRVMAKRRRAWRRELILALLVVIIAIGVGIYRRDHSGGSPARDWTFNGQPDQR